MSTASCKPRDESVTDESNAVIEAANSSPKTSQSNSEEHPSDQPPRAPNNPPIAVPDVPCVNLKDVAKVISETTWFWPRWLPRGHVSLLAGAPGVGKTLVALAVVDHLLNGHKWPDGQACETIGQVMWVDTEGTQAVLVERVKHLGLPPEKIFFPTKNAVEDLLLDNSGHWTKVKRAVLVKRPPLIVVDTLRGAYSGEENSSQAPGAVLKKLQSLARDTRAAILVIHHIRKRSELSLESELTLDSVRGNNAIAANARAVWGIEDSHVEGMKRLRILKSNLAAIPDPLGFVVDDEGVTWTDLPIPQGVQRALDEARIFIREFLRNEPQLATEIKVKARQAGISPATLQRAKTNLNVSSFKIEGRAGQWKWALPGHRQSGGSVDSEVPQGEQSGTPAQGRRVP